ncbi:MAG: hypothetical protein ABEH47_00805 [Haloferacaceae archaeon]
MKEREREVLRSELAASVEVTKTIPDYPAPDSEWLAVCRRNSDAWCIEKLRSESSRDTFAVYAGDYSASRGYRRRRFLDLFHSMEAAVECVNERA